jgi:hypothetical protein
MKRSRQFALACLAISFCLTVLIGCGSSSASPGRLSGKVTVNGDPVTGGSLSIHTDKGSILAPISTSGTYSVTDLPVGEWKVTVDTEMLNPKHKKPKDYGGKKGAMGPMPKDMKPPGAASGEGNYVEIPARYQRKDSTELSVTVTAGSQTKNFEMTK